jgi:hypothetical protein
VVVAIVVGKGDDRLASITDMRRLDDEVQLAFETPLAVGPAGEPAAVLDLEPVTPNPSTGPTRIGFTLTRATRARVNVIDLMGREVAVLVEGEFSPGRHATAWNGHGERGAVPAGVYFVCARAAEESRVRRMVVTR